MREEKQRRKKGPGRPKFSGTYRDKCDVRLNKEESVRWTGRADGTYDVEMIDLLPEVGTRVILQANWKCAIYLFFRRKYIRSTKGI